MATNLLQINDSTIVTGATSTASFLLVNINDKNVGIPLYEFSYSTPSLDFVDLLQLDFVIEGATLYSTATSYGAGLGLSINEENAAWPIYKLDQADEIDTILVQQPSLVSSLSSQGRFVAVQVNNKAYGVPLYDYSTEFPFTTSVAMSSIEVNTIMAKPTKNVGTDHTPSSNLNSKITTYQHLINRIKYQLGHPFVTLEICDDTQIVDFIDKALEWYTKYAGFTEEFLVFDSRIYGYPGLQIDQLFSRTVEMYETTSDGVSAAWDYDFGNYRKVAGIFSFEQGETTGINELFTLEQAMAQQTYFSYMLGNVGFDLVTWEVLKGWLDTREKVLAQTPYVDFNERTQLLRVIPPPARNQRYLGVVGAWVEKPIKDLIMERWIEHYALAITKIAIGNIRGKYQSMQLFGGGTINYNDLLSQGLEEKKALEEELMNGYGEVTPARFFIG
jgi:hypothetical protein